ncbi:MAG: hypothetical protein ABIL06_10160 [Pseudomonadota bacterium]
MKTCWSEIWALSWPLVLSLLLQFVVGLADVYVAGLFRPEVQSAMGFGGQVLGMHNLQRAEQVGWQVAGITALVLSLLAVPVIPWSLSGQTARTRWCST